VTGYEIDQPQEDRLKLQIDDGIKDIRPNVFPNDYQVSFIPVTDQYGQYMGKHFSNCVLIYVLITPSLWVGIFLIASMGAKLLLSKVYQYTFLPVAVEYII